MAVIKTQFTMRLDIKTQAKLQKIAQLENRSMTNMIDTLIKREIERYEEAHGEIQLTDDDISIK